MGATGRTVMLLDVIVTMASIIAVAPTNWWQRTDFPLYQNHSFDRKLKMILIFKLGTLENCSCWKKDLSASCMCGVISRSTGRRVVSWDGERQAQIKGESSNTSRLWETGRQPRWTTSRSVEQSSTVIPTVGQWNGASFLPNPVSYWLMAALRR